MGGGTDGAEGLMGRRTDVHDLMVQSRVAASKNCYIDADKLSLPRSY